MADERTDEIPDFTSWDQLRHDATVTLRVGDTLLSAEHFRDGTLDLWEFTYAGQTARVIVTNVNPPWNEADARMVGGTPHVNVNFLNATVESFLRDFLRLLP